MRYIETEDLEKEICDIVKAIKGKKKRTKAKISILKFIDKLGAISIVTYNELFEKFVDAKDMMESPKKYKWLMKKDKR